MPACLGHCLYKKLTYWGMSLQHSDMCQVLDSRCYAMTIAVSLLGVFNAYLVTTFCFFVRQYLITHFSDFQLACLGSFFLHESVFFLSGLPFIYLERAGLLSKYKIQVTLLSLLLDWIRFNYTMVSLSPTSLYGDVKPRVVSKLVGDLMFNRIYRF